MALNSENPPDGENARVVIAAAEERAARDWAAVQASGRRNDDDRLTLGRGLLTAKRDLPHGEFGPMLARLGIAKTTAHRAMKAARLGLKSSTVELLGGVEELAQYPDSMLDKLKADPETAHMLARQRPVALAYMAAVAAEEAGDMNEAAAAMERAKRLDAQAQESLQQAEAELQGQMH